MQTEKIVLFEIFLKDGHLHGGFPNQDDAHIYEIYGFLRLYLDALESDLLNDFDFKF